MDELQYDIGSIIEFTSAVNTRHRICITEIDEDGTISGRSAIANDSMWCSPDQITRVCAR